MKKIISFLIMGLFALLLQNASADPMGGPGPDGHPECPAGTTCGGPGDHHDGPEAACAAMGMADGSPHVDPPQDVLDQVKSEYEANCKNGNCFLGEGNYKRLEAMGHTRQKVDCFLAAGHREHEAQHGGPNHPPGQPGMHPPDGNHGPCPPDCGPPPGTAGHHPPGPRGPNHPPGPGGHVGSCPEGPGYDACMAAQSAASATKHHPGDTCMQHPAGPARDNCYQNQQGRHGGKHHDPNMPPPSGPNHPPGPGGPNHPPSSYDDKLMHIPAGGGMPPHMQPSGAGTMTGPGGPNHPPGPRGPNHPPGPGGPNDHHNGPGDHGPCPPDCGPGPNHMSGGNTGMPGGPNHPPGPGGPNHPPGPGNNSAAGQFIDPDCPPGTPAGTTCLPGGIIEGANGNNAGNPDQFIDPDCPPGTPAGTTCLPQ